MIPHRTWRTPFTALAVALCAIAVSGCASWQWPRIDPSGERLFLWPEEAPPATTYGVPPLGPPVVAPPGNVQAAPVWPDPGPSVPGNPLAPTVVGPPVTAPNPGPFWPPAGAPVAPGPVGAPAVVPPIVAPPTPVVLPGTVLPGQTHMRVTPERILAPVNSEVVLRAGICGGDGRLVNNERVEWLLARDSAGQIVDLSERGEWDLFRWVWDTPRKVDNWYAIGATTTHPVCLRRGNADPTDDVQVLSGEAWVTVTSPSEGTSYVTAYTPSIADWELRRATATIYWVDAQWVFPPSASVEPGRPHVLTTTVTRTTNGTPIAGWIVRYEVADGGASLGYDAGNVSEVLTDAAGQASVEISPTDGGSGTTVINMLLVRPATSGPDASPPLEIGTSSATITWGAGGAVSAPITSAPPPAYPIEAAPGETYTPPRPEPATGQPELEVRLSRLGPEQVSVGEVARFQVVVTNRGTGTATGIEVLDRFDRGLRHPEALPGESAVKYPGMRDLEPGESATVSLSFEVVSPGRLCHEVTVTAAGGEEAIDRMCVTAVAPEPPATPTLEVTKLGPTRQVVGELAKFKIVVKNTGDIPATNVEIVDQYDEPLVPRFTEAGREFLPDGRISWHIDRLEVGERREFRVQCECTAPAGNACNRVIVKADGGANYADESCLEVLAPLQPSGPGGDAAPTSGPLRVSIVETRNPMRAGQRNTVYVNVQNTGQQTERQVEVWLMFPPELTPDTSQIQPQGDFTTSGQEVRFNAIAELRPQQQQRFVIPVTAQRTGSVRIWARLSAASLAQPTTQQSNAIEIIRGP